MAKQSAGISGVGALFIVTGTYLIYIGIKDIGFTEGLQEIFQQKQIPKGGKQKRLEEPKSYLKEPIGTATGDVLDQADISIPDPF